MQEGTKRGLQLRDMAGHHTIGHLGNLRFVSVTQEPHHIRGRVLAAEAGGCENGGVRLAAFLQAHRGLVVAAAAVVPFAACALLAVFRESVANTNAALGLVLLVVAAASTGIRWAGIVAALSSAAWFDFFLTEPYNQFTIADRADIETAVLLLIVGAR